MREDEDRIEGLESNDRSVRGDETASLGRGVFNRGGAEVYEAGAGVSEYGGGSSVGISSSSDNGRSFSESLAAFRLSCIS